MMSASRKRRFGYTTLILLILVFVAAVMASNSLLRGVRFDLTQNNVFTLSPGTRAVLKDIDEPINLYLFYSNKETKDIPVLRSYAKRVHEMLDELAMEADGKLKIHVIDPEPFSEEEDRANQYGLQSVDLGTKGQDIFLGVAGTNSVGDTAKIPFLRPNKEPFLEYNLMRMIYGLAHPKKQVIGLISGIAMNGGYNAQARRVIPAWTISQQVGQFFDLRTLPKSFTKVDKDVDVLWIVQPENLDDQTLYAIDQFILGGGRALIFVDPLAEIAAAGGPQGAGSSSSDLTKLFKAWGVEYSPSQVVTDNINALSVSSGYGQQPARHIGLIGLPATSMDQKDVTTAGLDSINFADAGSLAKSDKAKVTFTPLLTSSEQSALMPASKMQIVRDPTQLLNDFVPSGKSYVLAARLSGHLETAFPNGPPGGSDAAKPATTDKTDTAASKDEQADAATKGNTESTDKTAGDAASPSADTGQLRSTDKANIIVVADVDVLSDRMWVQRQNFLGRTMETAFASNGDFVVNALDNLSGSAELIGLKSRAAYARPFTTVQALRRQADARFRAKQQELQAELMQTEKKLSDLQSTRNDKTSLLMTPAQQQEVQRFVDQQTQIRKQLRAVQHNLNEDIEQLGTRLKVIDILIMPLVLTLLAFFIFHTRRRRHGA